VSVHEPLPHDAAGLHVTGAARYVDDIPVPAGCLHLAFGLSTIAAGEIETLDLDAVRAAPGAFAVLAGRDFESIPDCSPSAGDEPLLSDGRIHYRGQPKFLVAAESHLAARKAAARATVACSERPAILSMDDAIAAGSIFEEGPRIYGRGDVDAAIAAAPHAVSGRIEIGGQEHFYLEGQVALALPQEGGDMLIHASSQHPAEIQHKVADALGLPMHGVRVEVRRMGGGFGGKESQGNHLAIACAVVAARTGRPAKMRYDRDDDFIVTGKRHDARISYRAGFDDAGRVAGVDFTHMIRCGWSMDLSLPVADRLSKTVTYADATALMRDLRAMGETNSLAQRRRRPAPRRLFAEAARRYAETYPASDDPARIRATFELVFLAGWAPHGDQRKPLRPGSARHRLADALNTAAFDETAPPVLLDRPDE